MVSTIGGIPVPDDTDPVADGAAAMRAIVQATPLILFGTVTILPSAVSTWTTTTVYFTNQFKTKPTVIVSVANALPNTPAGIQLAAVDMDLTTDIKTVIGVRREYNVFTVTVNWVAIGNRPS